MDRLVLITGGSGYVGSVLVPLIAKKYPVRVLETMTFGNPIADTPNVEFIQGDIRNQAIVSQALDGVTDVIHLAAIVTDDLVAMNEALGRQINNDALFGLCSIAMDKGVSRIIYASSSSIYGTDLHIDDVEVTTLGDTEKKFIPSVIRGCTEECIPKPMTEYAWTKLRGEYIVNSFDKDMTVVSVRSATCCGPAPRMRFDTIVNIFCKQAHFDGVITVHGGDQWRTNIHVKDIARLYCTLLDSPADLINGQAFNATASNDTALDLAHQVRRIIGGKVFVDLTKRDDRHYCMDASKVESVLGWVPELDIYDAISDNLLFFDEGNIPDPNSDLFYNTRRMGNLMQQGDYTS